MDNIQELAKKIDRLIDLLVEQKKVKVPEVDNTPVSDYIIMKKGKKDKKDRIQPYFILIDGVQKTTGDRVSLSEKQIARYEHEKGNFMKYDEKKFDYDKDKNKYFLKTKK